MTLESGRFSASAEKPARGALALIASLALLLPAASAALIAPILAGVEEEDIASQIAGFRAILDEGIGHLSSLDFPEAVESFTRVIDAYKAGKIPMVTPDAHLLVAKAFEGRALGFANQGKNGDASADFESLIRFDPAYTIEMKGISSKIITLYLGVRKKIVGVVTFEGEPIGSEVRLNDQPLGVTPIADKDWIAGSYHLVITHRGFDPYEEEIRVDAGGKLPKRFRLTPNARSVLILTAPRDVKVFVDGQEMGTTFGTAGAIYDPVATKLGLNRSDISEPLLIEYLKPGEHNLTLRKECFGAVTSTLPIKIDPGSNEPTTFEPFVLTPSRGTLDVDSEPSGAQILLDGQSAGTTPATIPGVCAGKHEVSLAKEGLGRSIESVDVGNGDVRKIRAALRLSLAAIDLRTGLHEAEGLAAALKGLKRYNLVTVGNGIPAEAADRVRLEMESSQGRGISDKTLKDLFQSLKVELIALAVPGSSLGDQTEFQLYSPSHSVPDRWSFDTSGAEGMRRVLFALEADLAVESAWSGLKLIDVYGRSHPVVLGVTMGSPAAVGGVVAGDLLVSVGTTPIQKASDLLPVLRKAAPGDDAVLTVESAGKVHDVKMKYLSTPVLLSMKDSAILYNKQIADIRQVAATASEASKRSFAWMNIGVAFMHFGRYEEAIREAFKRAELPEGAGISKGTVRYLVAICYEKLGLSNDARTAYLDASASATATLGSHDGPLLAPSARRRAAALGSQPKS